MDICSYLGKYSQEVVFCVVNIEKKRKEKEVSCVILLSILVMNDAYHHNT